MIHVSRINIRYYKKHPPAQLTNIEKMAIAASKALEEVGHVLAAWGNALFGAARDAWDVAHSREFAAAYLEACRSEHNEMKKEN